MESMMHVGNKVDKGFAANLVTMLAKVLESGFKNHSSENVIVKALDVVQNATKAENISVSYCTFNGEVAAKSPKGSIKKI